MIEGRLIAESLRVGGALGGVPLRLRRLWRVEAGAASAAQPTRWTLLDFEADDDVADRLAAALAGCLAPTGGWYCDFSTGSERFVVFADRIFRYRRGDAAGRAEAAAYGRAVGVPAPQLDWDE